MSNTFIDKSRKIANDFIQSVVFLDDRAFKSAKDEAKPNNSFEPFSITQAFAKKEKICAIYQPESLADIEDFKVITTKSDVIVLDWEINFPKNIGIGEEEEDDDHEAGLYTKSIIKSSLFEEKNKLTESLKLVIIYTGDYAILEDILINIFKEVFEENEKYLLNKNDLSIEFASFRVLVRAKNTEIRNETNEHYRKHMISYENMPNFVLNNFSDLTSGLLSNFALLSLTALRKNSSKIIGLFSSDMDSAYLGHKSILPKQEDAEELLIELFGDTIKDLLHYLNVSDKVRKELIDSWIDNKILEEEYEEIGKKFKRDKSILKSFLTSTTEDSKVRFGEILKNIDSGLKNKLLESPTKIFTTNDNIDNVEKTDKKFAKLTHHKSLFIPKSIRPKLTLGSLIRSSKDEKKYFICIQPKCDSVRIQKNEIRKFLFLPFDVKDTTDKNKKFDLLTDNGLELRKDKKSYAIRTIKFKCNDESGVIYAQKSDGKFYFNQIFTEDSDEQFEWILDLKDLHSQRIISEYASQLSRVGLDESEWHRRFFS